MEANESTDAKNKKSPSNKGAQFSLSFSNGSNLFVRTCVSSVFVPDCSVGQIVFLLKIANLAITSYLPFHIE